MLATRSFPFEVEIAGLGIYATGTCTHLRGRIETIDLDGGPSLEFTLFGHSGNDPTRRTIANAIKSGVERVYGEELESPADDARDSRADRQRDQAVAM